VLNTKADRSDWAVLDVRLRRGEALEVADNTGQAVPVLSSPVPAGSVRLSFAQFARVGYATYRARRRPPWGAGPPGRPAARPVAAGWECVPAPRSPTTTSRSPPTRPGRRLSRVSATYLRVPEGEVGNELLATPSTPTIPARRKDLAPAAARAAGAFGVGGQSLSARPSQRLVVEGALLSLPRW